MKTSRLVLSWVLISILCGLMMGGCKTATVKVSWLANPLKDEVAGYMVYCGTVSGKYIRVDDVGQNTHVDISNLKQGVTYYFAVTAYNSSGYESAFSDEVSVLIPVEYG